MTTHRQRVSSHRAPLSPGIASVHMRQQQVGQTRRAHIRLPMAAMLNGNQSHLPPFRDLLLPLGILFALVLL